MEKKPFILFDCEQIKDYIFTTNLANISPTRHTFSGKLLIVYYKKIIKKITLYIADQRYFNLIINEIFNIRKEQVQNFCIIIENQKTYYLCLDIIHNSNISINR